jgi:hypothetical protein
MKQQPVSVCLIIISKRTIGIAMTIAPMQQIHIVQQSASCGRQQNLQQPERPTPTIID